MIKMSNINITQRRNQAIGLCVMIGMCSPDCQNGRPDRLPSNSGCPFLGIRTTNQETIQTRDVNAKHGQEKTTKLHCNFRRNSTLGYIKRMIEIWQECTSFQTSSQRLVEQFGTIIKKGWFSDLEIQEIRQKTNKEQDTNTVSDTLGFDKQELSNRNEPTTWKNRNTKPCNNTEQTLTQKQKINLEI